MEESGGDDKGGRDEISLLAEELIQLSVKESMVVPTDKLTLICTIWTEKFYNLESFKAQMKNIWKTKKNFEITTVGQNLFLLEFDLDEDLEAIMEGRPWFFRKSVILYDRLTKQIKRAQIRLTSSPFWIKIGSCLPEFDKKDLLHAIGVTFGGVIRSEINGNSCRLKINLDVQKPLRRESNLIGKGNMKFNALSNKARVQSSYTGGSEFLSTNFITSIEENNKVWRAQRTSKETDATEPIQKQEEVSTTREDDELDEYKFSSISKKTSWKRRAQTGRFNQEESDNGTMKRKIPEEDTDRCQGSRGGLSLAWKDDIEVALRNFSKNHIDVMIKDAGDKKEWRFIGYNLSDVKVAELIDTNSRLWKKELIESTFSEEVADRILRIPLAAEPHDDLQAWNGEPSGEYTVRSAYKLLQSLDVDPRAYELQTEYRGLYKKLWLLNLPSKIKITVWKVTWNYLPLRANMQQRRLTNITFCPRCGNGTETMNHLFRECPVSVSSDPVQCRIFCCTLWAIWGDRNGRVHKKVSKSGKEIVNFVHSYIRELNEIETRRQKVFPVVSKWKHPPYQFVNINFDAAYDERSSHAALGIVARNSEGKVLLACSKIHNQVASAFAAEAIACRSATQLGIDMKWGNVIIEGDSLTIIKKYRIKSQDKSLIGAYIHDIQQISLKTQRYSFEYTPRTANHLAHIIATETMKSKKGIYLIGRVPEYAEKLKERDSVREPD
ncbi:hypothetical protein Goshw_001945 [Gossypium schwendimanii]|uniref:RNase H type-1 domain-containing protein n=1 Tax=Gossypium schwendimanii TaxID=34291 RepID=A0A7J9NCK1_GOSSC|nr:hypothetical protein [Gossypium schwendimanii]